MDSIKKITELFSVSPQITKEDVKKIAELGYSVIINNRPDNESDGQPSSDDIKDLALKNGLEYHYIPVISAGNISDDNIEELSNILENQKTPVLAFCRSGTRSTIVWALSQRSSLGQEKVVNCAKNAGYDIADCLNRN